MTYLSPRKRNWAPHYSFLLYYVHSYDDAMLRVGEGDQNSEWPASVLTTNTTIPDHGLSAITLYLVPPSTNNVTSCNRVRLHVFGHRTGGGNLTNFEAAATAAPNWAANAAKCPTCAPIRNKWVTILLVYCLYWPACPALPVRLSIDTFSRAGTGNCDACSYRSLLLWKSNLFRMHSPDLLWMCMDIECIEN